jgi:hypothetical protein
VTGARRGAGANATACSSTASARPTGSTGRGRAWIVRASRRKGGDAVGKNPTDRDTAQGAPGTKRHLVVGHRGVPLAAGPTGALLDAVEPVKRSRGQPCRTSLRRRGIADRIARKGVEDRARLGRHHWVVERTLARLACYRRLAIRYERRADIHQALLDRACAHICLNFLRRPDGFC